MKTIKTTEYIEKVAQVTAPDPMVNTGAMEGAPVPEMPSSPSVPVDMSKRPVSNPKLKGQLQKVVYSILKPTFFEKIPLGQISEAFKSFGVTLLQEDGAPWSGFLLGGKDCGDERAKDQRAEFALGYNGQLLNCYFIMSWCRMPSGKMEVIGYIS